ncbi:MAG TPA: 23S rRNA (uracil(1939)-C(5))-methyltransferase RlmD, partial [Candidatus Dormibacteraeota bacterium]|nr:23S rRNA (uracil(1939)-C(5))-methyltransferase RlmD [Candidatus Dormibacteraeota bacterium]
SGSNLSSVLSITTERESPEVAKAASHLLERLPGTLGIANSYDPNSTNAVMGREHRNVAGATSIEETIGGVRFRVSPESFFQVNPGVVAKIFAMMRGGLAEPRRIVDLYCGAGTFSLYFARAGSTVLGIEENPHAVDEGNANAELNDLTERTRFLTARVEDAVRQPEVVAEMRRADILFLDPPRKGSDEATLGAIAAASVPNIWYLSCDPATLARDLKFLTSNGYRIGIVQPFDMFPQTGHIETLVTLYCNAREIQAAVERAFVDAPIPEWPEDDRPTPTTEYPDFVIRED